MNVHTFLSGKRRFPLALTCFLVLITLPINKAWAFDSIINPYTAVVDGGGNEWIHHMVADDAGNMYLAGAWTSTAAEGLANIATHSNLGALAGANGESDAFVAKLTHKGELAWIARTSGNEEEAATGLGYDRTTDTLIVSGYFSGTNVPFGNSIQASAHENSSGVNSSGLVNLFVAAINPANGNWLSVEPMPITAQVNGGAPSTHFGGLEIRSGEYQTGGSVHDAPHTQIMGRALTLGPENLATGTAVYIKGMLNTTALTGPLASGNQGTLQLGAGIFRNVTKWNASGVANNGDTGQWAFLARVNFQKNAFNEIEWTWEWNAPIDGQPNSGTTSAITSVISPNHGNANNVYFSGYWRGSLQGPDNQNYTTAQGSQQGFVGALDTENGSITYLSTVSGASSIYSLGLKYPNPQNPSDTLKLVAAGGVAASSTDASGGPVDLLTISSIGNSTATPLNVPDWPEHADSDIPEFIQWPLLAELDATSGTWESYGIPSDGQSELQVRLNDVEVGLDGSIFIAGSHYNNELPEEITLPTPSKLRWTPSGGIQGTFSCEHTSTSNTVWSSLHVTMTVQAPNGSSESDTLCFGEQYQCGQGNSNLSSHSYFEFESASLMQALTNNSNFASDWDVSFDLEMKAYTSIGVAGPPGQEIEEYVEVECSGSVSMSSEQNLVQVISGQQTIKEGALNISGSNLNLSISGTGQARKQLWWYINGGPVQVGSFRSVIVSLQNLSSPTYSFDEPPPPPPPIIINGQAFIAKASDSTNWANQRIPLQWQEEAPKLEETSFVDSDGDGTPDAFDVYPNDSDRGAGIWREVYNNIGSSENVSALTSSPNFPHNPDTVEQLSLFEGPTNVANQYGSRLHGVFIAPETGNYTFWAAGDNNTLLSLSTDSSPTNKTSIASVVGYTLPRQWDKFSSQQSSPIPLIAGQAYYIEVLHKEGNGGDYVGVAWQRPSNSNIEVMSAAFFIPASDKVNTHVNEIALNSVQTLYSSAGSGVTPKVQGVSPGVVGTTPSIGNPSFTNRLQGLTGHGSIVSTFNTQSGATQAGFLSVQEFVVGDLIERPAGALAPTLGNDKRETEADGFTQRLDVPTNINIIGQPQQQVLYASEFDQEWYAAAPIEEARVLWPTTNDPAVQSPPLVGLTISIRWPENKSEGLREYLYGDPATQDHIPNVVLNPDDAADTFLALLWASDQTNNPTTATPNFIQDTTTGIQTLATTANGYASLLFHADANAATSAPRIQVIKALRWDENTSNSSAIVGQEITPPSDAMEGKTGYPMRPLSKHDADTQVFDPLTRQGQLVPVNQDRNPNLIEDDDIRIAWYEEDASLRDWPFRTVTYDITWPTEEQVVIASELCSTGVKANGDPQDPLSSTDGSITDLQLYVQNDPALPGFNPNDEHGLITQVEGTTAACALRTDIANTIRGECDDDSTTAKPSCYTSHPYLIVKAINTDETTTHEIQPWVYRVFEVKLYDSNYPNFNLSSGIAGNGLHPPFPLKLPGFASPSTMGAGDPFWVDVYGQVWARAAGDLTAKYFYPATGGSGDFYIDTNEDGINDANTAGDIPWLSGEDDPTTPGTNEGTNNEPIALTYSISWPEVVPELEIGDTLTDQRPNGLPAVRAMKTVDVIFDEQDKWEPEDRSSPTRHLDASLRVFDFTVPIGHPPPCVNIDIGEAEPYCEPQVSTNNGDAVIIGEVGNTDTLPAKFNLENGQWFFPTLPSHLRYRVFFDPTAGTQDQFGNVSGEFTFRGGDFDGETGRPYGGVGSKLTLINIMNDSERQVLKLLDNDDGFNNNIDDNVDSEWDNIVDALYHKSRNPAQLDLDGEDGADQEILAGFEIDDDADSGIEIQHQQGTGESALTAAFADQEGYITIAENNVIDGSNNPVNVHIIKIVESRARGALRVIRNADNQLDERLVIRHDLDFGGRDGMAFEWWWMPDNGSGIPPVNFSVSCAQPGPGTTGCPDPADGWLLLGETSDNSYTLKAGLEVVADGWMLARYKGLPTQSDPSGNDWIGYAGLFGLAPTDTVPVATAGWVKRVLEGVNEFEQKYDDLNENAPVTYSGLLVQAGKPYAGDVALNVDNGNLNDVGLIELYETVSNRARSLTIEAIDPITEQTAVNKQLLLVSNRLAEFSMILGDEAYSDAQDPTVGTVEVGGTASYLSPDQFAFQNQVSNLLEEELALLRGRSFDNNISDPYPLYNRLPWNFSSGSGEPVYVQVYGVTDLQDPLGAVDDAQRLFPQGHGDALGHYLDATKQYYQLALHPNYDWQPLTETTTIAGVPVEVDYADEQNFTRAASRKARTMARVLDLTYRDYYTHDPAGQWTGYQDVDSNRRWGVDGWARRGAQAAYLDYALANALLKHEDTQNTGLARIDRETVTEVDEIASNFSEIESLINLADSGRNPLGFSPDAVAFDISPSSLEDGQTHFDQMYSRAVRASVNALQVFNYANDLTQAIRSGQLSQSDLQAKVDTREQEFKHRLIELFGYPYSGDKGPNATYPTDYTGADIYHFMYLDATTIDGDDSQGLFPPTLVDTLTFKPSFSPTEYLSPSIDVSSARIDFIPADVLNGTEGDGFDRWFDVDPNATIDIPYPYATAGDYAFTAPAEWGKRQAPGKIQLALMDMMRLQARLKAALAKQQAAIDAALSNLEILEAKFDVTENSVSVRNNIFNTFATLNSALITMRQTKETVNQQGEMIYRIKEAITDCVGAANQVTGFSFTLPNLVRCSTRGVHASYIASRLTASTLLSIAQTPVEIAASLAQFSGSITFQTLSVPAETAVLLKNIEAEFRKELEIRYQIAEIGQELEVAAGKYESLVAQGHRVMEERITFRRDIARITTGARYKDYVYRVFRNDALQKYRASFDLASRYTYMAAKAFDYETGLLSDDPANGTFLDSILKQRALGQFTVSSSNIGNSTPLTNVEGLSDPLAKMKQAYDAMSTNFDNVYDQNVRFSLREEMMRIPSGTQHNETWQQALTDALVPNLWDVPEFRQYAVPPQAETAGPLPGLVLKFSTQINAGNNLFGWPLGPGDASYSTTYSATKFRRVGIDLLGYDGNTLLASTPYVYLLPVGMDVLRSPSQVDKVRQYAVVEQAIPVPVDLFNNGGFDQPGWSPLFNGITSNDSWDATRQHPQVQAGWGATSGQLQPLGSTRLVGRSVWNTEWMLIVPGVALLADQQEGLRRLIRGDGNGNGITDIELFFESFSVQ
ncbi:MAG: PA14 domain-containing protein [Pseudomonadales bacterium]|nr:PA14 domain-containing protein [Pseudomonadales bacterium]